MPQTFDPYRVWLGIAREERPPNHYRLLGLPLFEDEAAAIDHAADQRMAHLRTLQGGKHGAHASKLLNEVARARLCLLNPEKKAEYDRQLQKKLAPQPAATGAGNAPTVTWQGPTELGEYRLMEKLGEGGMGTVYKALHSRLDRVVAVKLLRRDHLRDEHSVARFDREIKAAGAVDHPNVVRAMDAREIDGTRLLAMEYAEGVDLNTLVARAHPISIADACELARQTAQGLDAVHQHGLVHRDVKPSNLMLDRRGQVKLLDLGLARLQRDRGGEEVTGTAQGLGTVDYMAPEQVGEARSVDIRADIYSLGCTLYKLLAGRPPFGGDPQRSPLERALAHVRERVPPIRKLRPDVPAEVARALDTMLAKSPEKRYATPSQVADALAPLAVGNDLPGLLTRAELGTAPAEAPGQAEVATGKVGSSSGLTRFFSALTAGKPRPAAAAPAAAGSRRAAARRPGRRRRQNLVLGIGAAVAAVVLGVALVLVAVQGGPGEATSTGLVIDLPETAREDLVLAIDGREVAVPAQGPVTFRSGPGKLHVYARRPGFEPFDELVAVRADGMTRIAPVLKEQAYLVLHWPRGERSGAKIELDGRPVDAARLIERDKPDEIAVPVAPGGHVLWLVRRGFAPFEQQVTVREGERFSVEPQWEPAAEGLAVAEPGGPGHPGPGEGPGQPAGPDGPPKPPGEESPQPATPPEPVIDPALERQRELEARFAEGMKPVEEKVAAWDFAGALEASQQVAFDEEGLNARLAQRREEIRRMARLKERMIARIKAARPPVKKSDLMLRGFAGEVTGANQSAITTKLNTGKTETLAWNELGDKAPAKLLQLVIDPKNPDDWLAAGLLAFAAGDTPLAERLLAQAQKNGADVAPYLSSLAAATFAEATALLDAKKYKEADAALTALETKYATTPWCTANQTPITAAREAAKSGIYETEADEHYTEAARLFEEKELFDVRDLVEKLKTDYPKSAAVTDPSRKPPFSEMAEAVRDLGQKLTVRLDGKGDFKSIQAAIDAAGPNTMIEIQDNGPYNEHVTIPNGVAGLAVRGKPGSWPVITSLGRAEPFENLVEVRGPRARLERVILLLAAPPWGGTKCIGVSAGSFRLNLVLVLMGRGHKSAEFTDTSHLRNSIFVSDIFQRRPITLENCLVLGNDVYFDYAPRIESCTIRKAVIYHKSAVLRDCILGTLAVRENKPGHRMEYCAVFDKADPIVTRDDHCLVTDPQFLDPKNLDYRLADTSPCKGKASDGGDLGCRYTPEMIEMCRIALELRARGIIKF